ncbi:3-deoxy-manno-octulosonate cytidylyltransferase [Candidatus Poribacteria bacterium]|jgi:3-deoxy-manno-octulosonate cytidylyltransferase (CMP-KDO synthetase)|nr:3-deoxy-manno-octulosonate cytidylyltransferase [Candidatus Poribacteria bacterium]MBT5533144.1 3-deoxy-manno-octulosonate cytidylyltransferase [Candidatus Poribacteria bacterium]MBT5709900.1 3-deoxy-manno-octulosonate cytidylyltransferase [Candidatus Poribacteria bacterium]MBT7095886.1 3-deoxy-manno-octulosonate cytidylyltransferase [Candidatus Poribacteria bacterium]
MSDATGVLAVIPARYDSSRFPGKPLARILGKPMIQHVYERASQCAMVDRVVVATDDDAIRTAVVGFGGEPVMTGACPTGTHRVAEAAAGLPQFGIVLNVQGDEPLLHPAMLEGLVTPFATRPDTVMTTLAEPMKQAKDYLSPDVVKVMRDRAGSALYFTRASAPGSRDGSVWDEGAPVLRHVGLYGYRAAFLQTMVHLDATPLESREGLEQLRAMEHGYRIHVSETDYATIGVDTPEELAAVEEILRARADGV